jgi:hypothetical protein
MDQRALSTDADGSPAPPLWGRVGVGGRAGLNRGFVRARSQSAEPHVNRLEHAIEIVKDIVIREAQDIVTLCGKRGRASGIESKLAVR